MATSVRNPSGLVAPSRTTASNNIGVTKSTILKKKTNRNRKVEETISAPHSLSDEDDSLEREVALNSPEKGKEFRQSTKVCQYRIMAN